MNKSQIIKSNIDRSHCFTWFDIQSKFIKFSMQNVSPLPKFSLVSRHHYYVITISVIIADSYDFFHIMVYG